LQLGSLILHMIIERDINSTILITFFLVNGVEILKGKR